MVRRRASIACASLATLLCGAPALQAAGNPPSQPGVGQGAIKLPRPAVAGTTSLEEALNRRRSVREYLQEPITPTELSQLLWAAQGISGPHGERTAPSAGALYPLQLYVIVADVVSLSPGIYAYRPQLHALDTLAAEDVLSELAAAAFGQTWMRTAPAVIVIAADDDKTTHKYGSRGKRFVHIEVGHAAQNVYLQATALNLATAIVGAFDEAQVGRILRLPRAEQPLALMPVGRPR